MPRTIRWLCSFLLVLSDIDFSAETGKVEKLDLGRNQSHVYAGSAVKDLW
ncbi:hypothetical protein HDF10_001494 [Edaphobacter lichenicola]|uniref:Uncharacterized protein n=1 Tax=Tunturiibacter lichenicola TaxID=2051959 RepID=A0A7W8N2W7_9BACT|nr:hypothetical protein [Edaphobacter lichenicola]